MKFLTDEEIKLFIDNLNLDVRKSKELNIRWIDQKCTIDVLCFVADCILNYCTQNSKDQFTRKEVQLFQYSNDNVKMLFKKPGTDLSMSESEYDKFFLQPMELFAFAGILSKTKRGITNVYKLESEDVLRYISNNERCTLKFLVNYIYKALKDSGLFDVFNKFLTNQTTLFYIKMRKEFFDFTYKYTNIKGKYEPGRIFTKVLNPLAFINDSKGTNDGRVSQDIISYDELFYNRDNFRDIYLEKPKGMTRQEFLLKNNIKPNPHVYKYQSAKAKRFIKDYNEKYRDNKSEVFENSEMEKTATQIHHIFAEHEFPQISAYYENLIALTPNQHYLKAHPNNRTQEINPEYQYVCLVAKAAIIEENLNQSVKPKIYEFGKFLFVLKTGLDDDSYEMVEENDYNGILTKLAISYNK